MPSTGNRYHHQHLASSASSSSDPIPQWQTLGQVRLRHRWSAGPSLQTMGLFGPDCFRSITRPTAASVFATLRATASNVLVLYHCREQESQLAATVQANNSRGDSLGTPTAPIHTHTQTRERRPVGPDSRRTAHKGRTVRTGTRYPHTSYCPPCKLQQKKKKGKTQSCSWARYGTLLDGVCLWFVGLWRQHPVRRTDCYHHYRAPTREAVSPHQTLEVLYFCMMFQLPHAARNTVILHRMIQALEWAAMRRHAL